MNVQVHEGKKKKETFAPSCDVLVHSRAKIVNKSETSILIKARCDKKGLKHKKKRSEMPGAVKQAKLGRLRQLHFVC